MPTEQPTEQPLNDEKMKLYRHINNRLGGMSIEVELEEEDFDTAVESALGKYRSGSTRSVDHGFLFLKGQPGQQVYRLREDVDEVREIRRVRSGIIVGPSFEPFSAAFIQNTLGMAAGSEHGVYGLFTYHAVAQYQEVVGRMFGEHIVYHYEPGDQRLTIFTLPKTEETFGLEVSVVKPLHYLLRDHFARDWIREWTLAECMTILGEKYRKFITAPGAQAGTALKGGDLVNDAKEMKDKLKQDLLDFSDGGDAIMPFFG